MEPTIFSVIASSAKITIQFASSLLQQIRYSRSKKLNIEILSQLHLDSIPIAIIRVINVGSHPIEIDQVYFELSMLWDNRPRLRRSSIRHLNEALSGRAPVYYASDAAILPPEPNWPTYLEENQSMFVKFSLDKMIEECFERGDGFKSKFFFNLNVRRAHVTASTFKGKSKALLDREIRDYLRMRYQDDPRIK